MKTLLKENSVVISKSVASIADMHSSRKAPENVELLVGYETVAREMQKFMYEGRPKRSKRIQHTEEEYHKFMEKMVKKLWRFHNSGLKAIDSGLTGEDV